MNRLPMRWGGARRGAGRPARGPIASEPHKRRPQLSPRHPVHVTARFAHTDRACSAETTQLARGATYRVLRRALDLSLARTDFRIVHLAVVASRLELIVEADDKHALARGMQGFQVSAAKWLNRAARRRGTVFPDRYRMRILATRVDVRDAIGRLPDAPSARTAAWPETWLLSAELAVTSERSQRRWIRSRADEDS
ncbi:MAG TPA: hypothetical protein VFV99_23595 [Kofleriaceae bacterium]|nr:hypothetical protein [Kofleriaceae bacterium]